MGLPLLEFNLFSIMCGVETSRIKVFERVYMQNGYHE